MTKDTIKSARRISYIKLLFVFVQLAWELQFYINKHEAKCTSNNSVWHLLLFLFTS